MTEPPVIVAPLPIVRFPGVPTLIAPVVLTCPATVRLSPFTKEMAPPPLSFHDPKVETRLAPVRLAPPTELPTRVPAAIRSVWLTVLPEIRVTVPLPASNWPVLIGPEALMVIGAPEVVIPAVEVKLPADAAPANPWTENAPPFVLMGALTVTAPPACTLSDTPLLLMATASVNLTKSSASSWTFAAAVLIVPGLTTSAVVVSLMSAAFVSGTGLPTLTSIDSGSRSQFPAVPFGAPAPM